MKDSHINKSIEKRMLQLSWSDKEGHYLIVFFFLVPSLITIAMLLGNLLNLTDKEPHEDFKYVLLFSIPLALLAYYFQRNRLRFKVIQCNNVDLFKITFSEFAKKQDKWLIDFENEKAIIIKTHPGFWSGSWGEQITLLFESNQILINSICDPDKPSSVFSAGRNKANVEFIVQRIKTASA